MNNKTESKVRLDLGNNQIVRVPRYLDNKKLIDLQCVLGQVEAPQGPSTHPTSFTGEYPESTQEDVSGADQRRASCPDAYAWQRITELDLQIRSARQKEQKDALVRELNYWRKDMPFPAELYK